MPSTVRPEMYRVLRFLISGGIATALNLLALYFLVHVMGLWYLTSSIVAFFVGFIASFTLQKFWTFKDHRRDVMGKQLVVYLGIVLVNLAFNTGLVYVFVEYAQFWPLIAQALASLTIAFEGFFAYRMLVFRDMSPRLEVLRLDAWRRKDTTSAISRENMSGTTLRGDEH